jgi:tetratricopeptide (TPR) repeat protein
MPSGAPIPTPQQPRPFPTLLPRLLPPVFFLLSLALFGTLLGTSPFPGFPAHSLVEALRLDGPGVSSAPVWETLVRLVARTGIPVPAAMNAFGTLCGALAIAILVSLMLRIPYRTVPGAIPADLLRERQARLFAAVTTGLFLLASVPWGFASTRSLPHTFHVLLCGVPLWLLARAAQTARDRWLFVLGFCLSAGSLEYPVLWPLFPAVLVAVGAILFQQGRIGRARPWFLWLLGLLLGTGAYVLFALHLIRSGQAPSAPDGGPATLSSTMVGILQNRAAEFLPYRHPGLFFAFAATWLPVVIVFFGSRRSPWYYGKDQMFLRTILAFIAVGWLLAELWLVMSIVHALFFALLPDAALAVAAGSIAGEFWIHGQPQMTDSEWPARLYRRFHASLAFLLPVLLAAVHFWHRPVVDARPAAILDTMAGSLLERTEPGTRIAVFGNQSVPGDGGMTDLLRLRNAANGSPVLVFDWTRMREASYFHWVLARWTDPVPGADAATPVLFSSHILRQMLADPGDPGAPGHATAFLLPPPAAPAGLRLAPDGWLYRPVPSATPWSPLTLPPPPLDLWRALAGANSPPAAPPHRNLVASYLAAFLALVSRNADAYGVLLAEAGDTGAAATAFAAGLDLFPANLSLLVNRIPSGADPAPAPVSPPPEDDCLARAIYDRSGRLWGLDTLYGPVFDPEPRAAHPDWLFVCSGIPPDRLAALSVDGHLPDDPLPPDVWERIFRCALSPAPAFSMVFSRLRQDPRDQEALIWLLRLFIRHHRPGLARSTLDALVHGGLDEELLQPEIACIERLLGDFPGSLARVVRHMSHAPSDTAGWLAALCWTSPPDPVFHEALQTLETRDAADREIRLAIGLRHCELHDWRAALASYNLALQIRSAPPILVRLITLSRILQDGSIDTLRASLRRTAPDHPLLKASVTRRPDGPEAAARRIRDLRELARSASQNPELLNAACESILYLSHAEDPEMRSWMRTAIDAQPWNPVFHCTLAEMLMTAGELKEAAHEARRSIAYAPDFAPAWVLSGELFRRTDRTAEARLCLRRAEVLPQGALSPSQAELLSALRSTLAATAEP